MRKLGKAFTLLLAGALAASMGACGGGNSSSSAPADGGNTNAPAADAGNNAPAADAGDAGDAGAAAAGALPTDTSCELTYVSWNSNQEEQNRATIDAFNKIYPNVKINLSYSTWDEYWNKLEASASSNQLADLVTMHTNTIEMYVNNDFMADLTDLDKIDPNFSYDNHPEDVKKLYRFKDKMWGVPKDFDCIVLIYNKTMFDEKGLEYPTDDWTWDQLEEAAAALTDKANNKYGFGARNDEQAGWASFFYQNGGGILNEDGTKALLDDPKTIEAMQWWMKMYENYCPPMSTYSESDPQTVFAAGTVAMQTIGNWDMNFYTDNEALAGTWDICALPHPANGTKATIMNGLALSVAASSKNIDAAKQFAAYFGTEQGQMDAAMGPSIPCYTGVSDKWAELNGDKFNTNAVLSQMQYGVQWVGTEAKTQWDAAMNTEITKIYNEGKDITAALTDAAAQVNEILAEEQANKK